MSDIQDSLRRYDTFPKILLRNAEERPDDPAYRIKYHGIWQTYSWRRTADMARELALGLADLGVKRGDKVAMIGYNRPEFYIAFDALEGLGAIPVPLYADSVADEMEYVLDHAEVSFAICEDQEQTDKILAVRERLPAVQTLIYVETKGMRNYHQPFLHEFAEVMAKGREFEAANPDFWLTEVAKANGDELALIAYTSGTTGRPKGVMLSANALIDAGKMGIEFDGLKDEEILAYLPLAWVGDHFISFGQGHVGGFTVNCPESTDTVMLDLKDVGPTSFLAPPAIFENFLTQIQIRMEDAGWIKKAMYDYFIRVAGRAGVAKLEGRPVNLLDRLLYGLGEILVYGPLKNNLGFTRVRVAYTGGAPLGEEVFDFYRSIGLNLKQLYGQTESSAYCCLQKNGDVKRDTVGPPAPGVDLRLTDEGEVLYRSPGNFLGYYKNEEATKETLDEEGFVHTGDAGIIDDSGHLKIIDRAKDVGTLQNGTLFAPQYIENKLKFFPYVREAVAHGADRDQVACFVSIDLEAVGNWAEKRGLSYTSYTDLASKDEVYDLIRDCVEKVNRTLAEDSALAGAQIKRFMLLHKELDADDGELTRTRKVRRRIIAERYDKMIEALYSDVDQIHVEVQMTFEDGRTGMVEADLKIRDAEVYPAAVDQAA
ncbi:MAG: AMP-binding protein [Alphaproteobacteria bacterium]|jgi:long-chain acyl-CoA synthetase|nr:AMP-binding protein [Alphaproteobacteria bacterium]MDP6564500.1 AMP-binding protein [Alphaproteobacteria bacterium]